MDLSRAFVAGHGIQLPLMRGMRCSLTKIVKNQSSRPDYINRIVQYLPYRSKALKNLQNELFPTQKQKTTSIESPLTTLPTDFKSEQNIHVQVSAIMKMGLLSITSENRGLVNVFTKKEANEVQKYDLLNFRAIGQQEFLQRIAAVFP